MSRRELTDKLPECVLVAAALAWCGVCLAQVAGMWFVGDDFDFLLKRSLALGGEGGVLAPHNEHWSTIPIVVYRLNVAMFGLHHYLPYGALPPLLHVCITLQVFLLLRRSGVRAWPAALAGLTVLFVAAGVGWENVLWDFQIAFLGACAAGLGALLLLQADSGVVRRTILPAIVLTAGMMCSAIGLVVTFWAAAFMALRHGLRAATALVLLPMATFLVWFTTIGHTHVGEHAGPAATLHGALVGIDSIWSTVIRVPHSGAVAMVVLIAVTVRHRTMPVFALAASGLATVPVAFGLFAYGRAELGVGVLSQSRYLYLGVVFCAPALALTLDVAGAWLARRSVPMASLAGGSVAGLALCTGLGQLLAHADVWQALTAPNEARLAAAADMVGRHEAILRPYGVPFFSAGIGTEALTSPDVRRTIPRDSSPQAALDVAVSLQVDVRTSSFDLPLATRVTGLGASPQARGTRGVGPRCTTSEMSVSRTFTVPPRAGGVEIELLPGGGTLTTRLARAGDLSAPVEWTVTPHQPVFVATTAPTASLRVVVPPGRTTICTR